MGISISKHPIIPSNEVEKIINRNNENLENYFNNNFMNYEIDIRFFQKQILKSKNLDFVKGIFSLFSDEIMSFNDFKQFYSILLSNKYEYVLKFISYLLFYPKNEVNESDYKKKVYLFFYQPHNKNILLSDLLNANINITNINGMYSREKFYHYFLNNKQFERKIKNNFYLKIYAPSSKLLKYDENILIVCDCDSINEPNKINNKSEYYEKYVNFYERLKGEFQNIENKNNGIFPYKKLEEMLIEVDVDRIFIKLIIRYLKLKIMRLNFLIFKEFMLNIICCRTIAQKAEFIFEILTFPELKEIKEEILEELVKNKNFEIKKISKEEFMNVYLNNVESNELVILLKSFLQNFDKINLIPYLNFGLTPFEPIILKNFIFKKYLNNNKDLHELCLSRIKTDNYFYVINSEFLNQLKEYCNQNNNNEKPIIDLYDLITNEGKLKTDKYYKKDFYLVPTDFYYFLEKVFIKKGGDIKLKKLQYNINQYPQETPDPDQKINSLILKEENIVYEIEFYYIHCKFFSFKEIYDYIQDKNENEYKDKNNIEKTLILMNNLYNKRNFSNLRSKYFPPKTECSLMLEQAINLVLPYDNNVNNPMIYNFNEGNLQIMDIKSILGNYLINNNQENYFCIIILDWKINNKKNSLTYYEKIQDLKEEPEEKIDNNNNNNNNNDNKQENKNENEINNKNENKLDENKNQIIKNEKEIKEKILEKQKEFIPNPIGLNNLGNTCYMNSVIQSLINIPLVRDIFLDEKIIFFLNKKGKFSNEGKVFEEFHKILDLRWKNSNSNKIFTPKSFKEIIGKLRKEFSSNEQQDANELMNFLIDELHEELNIINERKYIINPENEVLHNNDNELSNLYWANNLRRSCSFIYALFNFQLKSILTCEKCNKQKITYENNTSLFLPVPLSKLIDININLYRLPFRFKIYYDKINSDFVNFCQKEENKDISNKIKLLDKYMLFYIKNISKENEEKKNNKENKEKNEFENDEEDDEEFSFDNKSFPISIQLNINKTLKLENILTKLISIKNLELEPREINEKNNTKEIIDNGKNELIRSEIKTYTSFIICTIGGKFENVLTYVNKDMIIDNCVQNGGKLYIFEVLNSNGINEVKNYLYNNNNNEKNNVNLVNYNLKNDIKNFDQIYKYSNIKSENEILSFDNQILYDKNNELKKNFEFGIRIYHINQKYKNTFLIEPFKIRQIQFLPDFILSNNTENHLNSMLLYDLIWEKYKIYLNKSNKTDDELWWRTKKNNYKVCYPFNISICELVDGNLKCAKCPWYKLCPGCILNPNDNSKFIFDVNNNYIIVKWCSNVEKNEIIPNLIKKMTVLKEEIIEDDNKDNKNSMNEKDLNDCINIFLEKEKLEDQLKCSNCNKLRTFYKNFQFDKLSQILIVSLKRFKYSSIINNKINTFVKYPLKNLEINNELFDLYGVIHHIGSLNSGHYTCMLKINEKWFLFDDAHFREISEENVVSYSAYILIYINKNKPEEKMYYNILMNIMNQINLNDDKKYLKNNCKEFKEFKSDKFYLGEPIKTEYGLGYFNGEDEKFIHVKFEFGYGKLYKKNNKIEKQIKLFIGNVPLTVEPLKKIKVKKNSFDKKVEKSFNNNNINDNNKFNNVSYVNHKLNINNDKLNEQIKKEINKNKRENINNKNDCIIF